LAGQEAILEKAKVFDGKPGPSRRSVLQTSLFGAASVALAPALSGGRALAAAPTASEVKPFPFDEANISDLQSRMKSGELSAQALTAAYLARIGEIDKAGPRLNSVIEGNPDALSIAETLDKERKQKGPRGPMHITDRKSGLMVTNSTITGNTAATGSGLNIDAGSAPGTLFTIMNSTITNNIDASGAAGVNAGPTSSDCGAGGKAPG
jgi:hypothetical protein